MAAFAYNPSMWEVEAGGRIVRGQLGLHSETRYQKLQEEGDGLMDNVLAIQSQRLQ